MVDCETVKAQVHGPVMGLLTPFRDDGAIDFTSLARYVEHLVCAPLGVLAFSPMVSSTCVLTADEVLKVSAEVKQIAGDRAIVLATTRGDSPPETYDLVRSLEKHGVDGVFVFPGYFAPKPQIYVDLLTRCCQCTAMPIFGFQVSVEFDRRWGGLAWMNLDDWHRVAQCPQIIGLKDDTGNLEARKAMIDRFGDRFNIVGPGMPERYVQIHHLPGQAELSLIAHLDVAQELHFHARLASGDAEGAQVILRRALDTVQRIRQVAGTAWGIEPFHAIAHLRRLFETPTLRAPLPTLSNDQIKVIGRLLAQYDGEA